jgi:hypothetical protein
MILLEPAKKQTGEMDKWWKERKRKKIRNLVAARTTRNGIPNNNHS